MKNSWLLILVISLAFYGCSPYSLEDHLAEGLKKTRKKRYIHKDLRAHYGFEEIGFFKKENEDYYFVFKLSEDTAADTVAKYGLGLVYYTSDGSLPDKNYEIVHMKSHIKEVNGYKYIVEEVSPPSVHLDSLHIFLTGRENYTGVKGRMAYLRNIELK